MNEQIISNSEMEKAVRQGKVTSTVDELLDLGDENFDIPGPHYISLAITKEPKTLQDCIRLHIIRRLMAAGQGGYIEWDGRSIREFGADYAKKYQLQPISVYDSVGLWLEYLNVADMYSNWFPEEEVRNVLCRMGEDGELTLVNLGANENGVEMVGAVMASFVFVS